MRSFLSSLAAGIAMLGLLTVTLSPAAAQTPANPQTGTANVTTAPAITYPGYTGSYRPTYTMPPYNPQTYSYVLPAAPYYNGPQYTQGTTNYAAPVYPNSGAIAYGAPTSYNGPSFGGVRYPGNMTFMYPTYTGVIHYPGNLNYYFYTPYIFHP